MEKHLLFYSKLIKVLFSSVTSKFILTDHTINIKGELCIKFKDLLTMLQSEMREYSSDEIIQQLNKVGLEYKRSDCIPIFPILFDFSDKIITRCNEKYHFSFKHCDVWRNVTVKIDEEYFVASKSVQENYRRKMEQSTDFSWSYCIEHDNHQLSKLLNRDNGVSDNHFHLRGSSPYYHVSWIMLMNDFDNPVFDDKLHYLDNYKLTELKATDTSLIDTTLSTLRLKAAAIRLYLFAFLNKIPIYFKNDLIPCHLIKKFIDIEQDNCNKCRYNEALLLEQVSQLMITHPKFKSQFWNIWNNKIYSQLTALLKKDILPLSFAYDLKKCIDIIKSSRSCLTGIDYAIPLNTTHNGNHYPELVGERWILYYSLHYIYKHLDNYPCIEKLIYHYMIIKNQFRAELVQCNENIGFDNFNLYQSRKDWFIPWSYESERKLAEATIESILDGPKINCLELRISPAYPYEPTTDLCAENARMIKLYDEAIEKAIKDTNSQCSIDDFIYTFHFIKTKDGNHSNYVCRHYALRELVARQGDSILDMRIRYEDAARRVRAIDACNSELDCRPEVFSNVFRKLCYHDTPNPSKNLPQLQITYHVGEDNYDIVDGLRAIHEAVIFLEMRSGSRLGHATMLGISAKDFYKRKNNTISMTRQYFLDNVVWMYYYIQEHSIYFQGLSNLMNYLKDKYIEMYLSVYGEKNQKECDMRTYYLSWLLRGDDPYLYKSGYFNRTEKH